MKLVIILILLCYFFMVKSWAMQSGSMNRENVAKE
jgi:hypothetical protein